MIIHYHDHHQNHDDHDQHYDDGDDEDKNFTFHSKAKFIKAEDYNDDQ